MEGDFKSRHCIVTGLNTRMEGNALFRSTSCVSEEAEKNCKWRDFINRKRPSVHYMYRQFNIQQFYVLPTQCIYVFCVDLRTNSDYFPIQH